MFLIYSDSSRKMSLIKKVLSGVEGLTVKETKFPEYLFVDRDPSRFIPGHLMSGVKVDRFEGGYTRFLKNAGRIAELLRKAEPETLAPGDPVKVMAGRFEGFSGIVKAVSEKDCEVEVNVWGNIIRTTCARCDVKKVETAF